MRVVSVTGFAEGEASKPSDKFVGGISLMKETVYFGPCTPPGPLHHYTFTLIATTHVPELALLLVPFALLVAASRVVLGLHYPTDVLAGAAIGAAFARAVVSFWPV